MLFISLPISAQDKSPAMLETLPIFNFGADSPQVRVVNDGVMGGRSQGRYQLSDGVLRFDGTLVTRGGGFTSLRIDGPHDLSGYVGIAMRVRGSGRDFQLEVSDRLAYRGRLLSRRASFATVEQWQWVHIPFERLEASIIGQPVSAPMLDAGEVQRIGIFIADGIDGDFWLEVDQMTAYRIVDSTP